MVEEDHVESREGEGQVAAEENKARMENREFWGHRVKRGNRESRESLVPGESPEQRGNPENPFHLPR